MYICVSKNNLQYVCYKRTSFILILFLTQFSKSLKKANILTKYACLCLNSKIFFCLVVAFVQNGQWSNSVQIFHLTGALYHSQQFCTIWHNMAICLSHKTLLVPCAGIAHTCAHLSVGRCRWLKEGQSGTLRF